MSDKHTLGPWKYDPIYDDGSMLKQRLLPARIIAGSNQVVAVFTLEGVPSYADALLIAAAPDLLEALKQAHAMIHDHDFGGAIITIEDAIAKAEGRQADREEPTP